MEKLSLGTAHDAFFACKSDFPLFELPAMPRLKIFKNYIPLVLPPLNPIVTPNLESLTITYPPQVEIPPTFFQDLDTVRYLKIVKLPFQNLVQLCCTFRYDPSFECSNFLLILFGACAQLHLTTLKLFLSHVYSFGQLVRAWIKHGEKLFSRGTKFLASWIYIN